MGKLIYNQVMLDEILPLDTEAYPLPDSNLEALQAHIEYNVLMGVHIDLLAEYWEITPKEIHCLLHLYGYYWREGVN